MPTAGTSAKSDERRREVVTAAISCFAQKGFYGTTTHEVAQSVGISQPYLYRLYPNKQALFASAIDRVSILMTEALNTYSPAPGGAGLLRNQHSTRRATPTPRSSRTRPSCAS